MVTGTILMARGAPARRKKRISGWHFVLAPIAIVFAIPFVQMFLAALSPEAELVQYPPPFVPSRLTLDGVVELFATTNIWHWLLNSAIVATSAIVSHIVLCSLAGYGFARLKFYGRNVGIMLILGTIMIPTQLLMIPTYLLFSRLGLVNTLGAAIVPWLASAFGIFLMRQFFLSIPVEIEESGRVDGANRLQIFWHLVLPLAKPALATLAIFALLDSWNDLIWPLIAINDDAAFTVQLGIANFKGTHHTQWSLLMSGNVLATLPLLAFFMVAQQQFLETMTFSGLKG